MVNQRIWYKASVIWLIELFVSSLGLAAAITILNLASRVIMGMGGFVASGGAYEIAVEAPDWALLIPASILSGFAFGGLSLSASNRSGGYNLIVPVWGALFISLGVQFGIMGFSPPGGGGIAWGWVLCAVVFIPMGLIPVINLLRGEDLFGGGMMWRPQVQQPFKDLLYRKVYTVCVLIGAAAGVAGGFLLFHALAG
ncbi:MAG: hypothetical protein JXA25_18335 [Anaerolineales bacterium]|nr:hypothetical protein [Anaerolineales bacterium]